ncbi:MAG: type I-E CRISPR-associated protein Cas7/Cse4/CasC [Anaerovoracaceae bacterium]
MDAVIDSLAVLLKSFVCSMPTGMIHSYANETIPDFVMVDLRCDRPVNLVTAFENPVKNDNGYVEPSIERLCAEHEKVKRMTQSPLATLYISLDGDDRKVLGKQEEDLESMMKNMGADIYNYFGE